jgi:aryl sulfotransferase
MMTMTITKPTIRHIYQNHTLDSKRWDHYSARPDDIVIATPYRSGTTWMQIIVMNLIFQDLIVRRVFDYSPWFEQRAVLLDETVQLLEQQQHRRFIMTHLPLDGLPYFEEVKYIVVNRDARDVFMSMWTFYKGFSDESMPPMNTGPHRVEDPLPRCPEDIHDFWQQWITQGWFDWESEGYPFWSNLRHVQTWWDFRHLPNILFVHFNDLLGNLEAEIQRVADYLAIDVTPDLRTKIAEAVSFKRTKGNEEQLGKGKNFFYKGTNGRWRTVLSDDELQLYQNAVARELSPDCAHWLEYGRNGLS